MRPIDADKLIADLEYDIAIDEDILNYVGTVGAERTNTQFDKDCKQNAIDLLMTAPTIEARPKGEWVDGHRMKMGGCYYWFRECSECGYERDDDDTDKDTNFCPNCGARMKGADDE